MASRKYWVKEFFYSIQGEGRFVGRPAVFCRFSGCNLWDGREESRSSAGCNFCDTDFVGGIHYHSEDDLVRDLVSLWPDKYTTDPFIVLTGGEPALQVNLYLISAFSRKNCELCIETNGTKSLPIGIDHVCVSPKPRTKLVVTSGDDLKLVFPHPELDPKDYERLNFRRFYLQPMDGPDLHSNTQKTVEYCLKNPFWSISLQTHKILGLR